ncbi:MULTISPECIES: LLM class flavin-dependent oxidoreductase [Actibacterium]|uniref:Luciferase-like monooxygenase n=1 Tax=Actibacterium naphthalenivorans TaxID=1614693 RepID=A0A840C9P3_9RHOB|nr:MULTISPECIES: LLM class flavin-dependent oxidoreductase [Actibacterium]ALG91578.1 alkane 1-monooxygenase [Actibacterium sp. EMB200-NS6]MBB4021800.1 luciferase family oxidoreductase group 1 [Actibacterium naphthalenivorans]
MTPYSLLDLAPIPEGFTAVDALRNTVDLARHAETWGYQRHWMAEHHNMPGIASAATAVLIGHVAGATQSIRVGAGGIMLPNHAPLVVAEQFGTLATLYPGRIDLGLGRAPGTDGATARALRRGMQAGDTFPQDVQELIGYFGEADPKAHVRAIPGTGTHVPVWILGSSLYGAQLAAHFGLPYAFASHFSPDALEQAFEVYRRSFRPSPHLDAPYAMMAINAFAADTDAEGVRLKTSIQQTFANLRLGRPAALARPVNNIHDVLDPGTAASVDRALSISATGAPDTVRAALAGFIERLAPDEIIITGQIHDHAARLKSFRLVAEAMQSLAG